MAKNKVEGLVEKEKGSFEGLVGEIKHHCGENKLKLCAIGGLNAIAYRGRMLETDLGTLNNALLEILNIAKKKNYKEIIEILEKRKYEHGNDFNYE